MVEIINHLMEIQKMENKKTEKINNEQVWDAISNMQEMGFSLDAIEAELNREAN